MRAAAPVALTPELARRHVIEAARDIALLHQGVEQGVYPREEAAPAIASLVEMHDNAKAFLAARGEFAISGVSA